MKGELIASSCWGYINEDGEEEDECTLVDKLQKMWEAEERKEFEGLCLEAQVLPQDAMKEGERENVTALPSASASSSLSPTSSVSNVSHHGRVLHPCFMNEGGGVGLFM